MRHNTETMAIVNKTTKILLLLALYSSVAFAADCGGRPFLCVNSTHFNICVDFGNGVSYTVGNFIIGCPPGTECSGRNHFECEIPSPTIPGADVATSDATNDGTAKGERSVTTTTNEPPPSITDAVVPSKYENTNSSDASADSTALGHSDPDTTVPTGSTVFSDAMTTSVTITADKDNPSSDVVTSVEPFGLHTVLIEEAGPVEYPVTSATTTGIASSVQPILQSEATTVNSVDVADVTTSLVPDATIQSDKFSSDATISNPTGADFSGSTSVTENASLYETLSNYTQNGTKQFTDTTTEVNVQITTVGALEEFSTEPKSTDTQSPPQWTDSNLFTIPKVLTFVPSSEKSLLVTSELQNSSQPIERGISTHGPEMNFEALPSDVGESVTTLWSDSDLTTRPSFMSIVTTINPPAQTPENWNSESYTSVADKDVVTVVESQERRANVPGYYVTTPPVAEITTEKYITESPDVITITGNPQRKEIYYINTLSMSTTDINLDKPTESGLETININTAATPELRLENRATREKYETISSLDVAITNENIKEEKQSTTPIFTMTTGPLQEVDTTIDPLESVTDSDLNIAAAKHTTESHPNIDDKIVLQEIPATSAEPEIYGTNYSLSNENSLNKIATALNIDMNIENHTEVVDTNISAANNHESLNKTNAALQHSGNMNLIDVETNTEIMDSGTVRIKKESADSKTSADWNVPTEGYIEVDTLEYYDTMQLFDDKVTTDKIKIENQKDRGAITGIQSNSIADINTEIATVNTISKSDNYINDAVKVDITATSTTADRLQLDFDSISDKYNDQQQTLNDLITTTENAKIETKSSISEFNLKAEAGVITNTPTIVQNLELTMKRDSTVAKDLLTTDTDLHLLAQSTARQNGDVITKNAVAYQSSSPETSVTTENYETSLDRFVDTNTHNVIVQQQTVTNGKPLYEITSAIPQQYKIDSKASSKSGLDWKATESATDVNTSGADKYVNDLTSVTKLDSKIIAENPRQKDIASQTLSGLESESNSSQKHIQTAEQSITTETKPEGETILHNPLGSIIFHDHTKQPDVTGNENQDNKITYYKEDAIPKLIINMTELPASFKAKHDDLLLETNSAMSLPAIVKTIADKSTTEVNQETKLVDPISLDLPKTTNQQINFDSASAWQRNVVTTASGNVIHNSNDNVFTTESTGATRTEYIISTVSVNVVNVPQTTIEKINMDSAKVYETTENLNVLNIIPTLQTTISKSPSNNHAEVPDLTLNTENLSIVNLVTIQKSTTSKLSSNNTIEVPLSTRSTENATNTLVDNHTKAPKTTVSTENINIVSIPEIVNVIDTVPISQTSIRKETTNAHTEVLETTDHMESVNIINSVPLSQTTISKMTNDKNTDVTESTVNTENVNVDNNVPIPQTMNKILIPNVTTEAPEIIVNTENVNDVTIATKEDEISYNWNILKSIPIMTITSTRNDHTVVPETTANTEKVNDFNVVPIPQSTNVKLSNNNHTEVTELTVRTEQVVNVTEQVSTPRTKKDELIPINPTKKPQFTVSTENYGLVESVWSTIILHPATVKERLQTDPMTSDDKAKATLKKTESEKSNEANSKLDFIRKPATDTSSVTDNPMKAEVKTITTETESNISPNIHKPEPNPKAEATSAKPPVKTTIKPPVKTTLISEFNCTNVPRGRYSDAHDCRKFYACGDKTNPTVGYCPVNTVFSEIKKQCVRNFSHCIRGNEFKCASNGRFVDLSIDNIFYICVKRGKLFLRFTFQCQNGYSLDRTAVKCIQNLSGENDSVSISDSAKKPEKRQSIKSTTSSSGITKKPSKDSGSGEKEFTCKTTGNFPHISDCRKYYICIKTKKSEYKRKIGKCDSDEVFNQDKKKCVDADSYECQL